MNRSGIFEQMLSQHDTSNEALQRNATYEVTQQIILSALNRGGFFEKAAFYGGTCLRIFHKLNRYSEDMDFTLLKEDASFSIEHYFPAIIAEFEAVGHTVNITKKDKRTFGKVESAFLKDNTHVYNIAFQTEKSIKVKIEVDVKPPLGFETEQKVLQLPIKFMTRCVTLPYLFAGKMHALMFRTWQTRIKGRDWYDFEWYVQHGVPLDFAHFRQRVLDFNGLDLTQDEMKTRLRARLAESSMDSVKDDVLSFLMDKSEIDDWNNDYFVSLVDRIKFK